MYVDKENDITITAPHTDIDIAKANIQPYLQDVLKWTKDNDLLLNTDKTTCTLPRPTRITQTWSQVCQVRVVRTLKSHCVTAEHVDTPNLS